MCINHTGFSGARSVELDAIADRLKALHVTRTDADARLIELVDKLRQIERGAR